MSLFTKDGRPLLVMGDIVYSQSGQVVGKIRGEKVFGTHGTYIGTIDNGRLVFRNSDSGESSAAFSAENHAPVELADAAPVAISGDEPWTPD